MDVHHTTSAVSESLLHHVSESHCSERRKLNHALRWANRFLSSGSGVFSDLCRADSLILANEKNEQKKETEKRSPPCPSAANYYCPVSCAAGTEGGSAETPWQPKPTNYKHSEQSNFLCEFKPSLQEDIHIPLSFNQGTDELFWPKTQEIEHMKSMELQQTTSKQLPSLDNCRTSRLHICNTYIFDCSTNQSFPSETATCLIDDNDTGKNSVVTDSVDKLYETVGAQPKGNISENHKKQMKKVKSMAGVDKEKIDATFEEKYGNKKQKSSSSFMAYADDNVNCRQLENIPEQTATPSFSFRLKIPLHLNIYEKYQLCVEQLHHFRQRQHVKLGSFMESPAKGRKTSEENEASVQAPALPSACFEFQSSISNAEIKKGFNEAKNERVIAEEITAKWSSAAADKKRDNHSRYRTTLTEHEETKHYGFSTMNKSKKVGHKKTLNGNRHGDFMKRTITSSDVINTPVQYLKAMLETSILANSGLKCQPSGVKGQKKKTGDRLPWRVCVDSSMVNLFRNEGLPSRPQRLNTQMHTRRHTQVKHTSYHRDTHTCMQTTETHTLHHDDTRTTSPDSGTSAHAVVDTGCRYRPTGVPVRDRWMHLPDEVWLAILSLLPPSDLCRVMQVCSRLHTLAADHTLWKILKIDNSSLTERWLIFVGKCRPHSLCLYSCQAPSVTSCGLEMFFTLCGDSLEEVKVTSCTGPVLHGDQILPLIGQLCNHVTSVDVSWSGATDTGVKALSDGCMGSRLRSIVLNGCLVTDDSLKKLVMKHKDSLCRLEVFGCQFLTPSCLQTIYEMCPGLKHLNIGQVPKVNTHSLTVMTQLKCLISLNLTGLQAVTDTTVNTLLQNCVKLWSLTLSSCPGVTNLTLHNISKYAPCIRSLDMSGCRRVTDAGVQSLSLGCRRLQQLDLSSTGTRNRGVTLLANYCSEHLHTVKLSFCHITSENILKLCRCCKRLRVLHLYGCAYIPTEREINEVNTFVKVYPLP